ncbi:MAG: uroporphyrinogen decarboxylase family protein [Planctomycetota bacterium]
MASSSRERVLQALDQVETDRVPVDFSGHRSSGIAAIAYAKLRRHLGLEPRPIRVYDIVQQLAVVDEDVLRRFGVDTIELGRGFSVSEEEWADWVLPDGTPCKVPSWSVPERDGDRWVLRSRSGRAIAQMPDGALYFEQAHWPFLDGPERIDALPEAFAESMWTAIASPPGPHVSDRELAAGARRLRESTDRAILGLFGGNLLEIGQFLYRIDHFLAMLAGEPRRVHAFLDKLVERHLAELERYLGLVGTYIDIIVFGDDLGMQTGPQMSPKTYREFFKPRHALLWKRAKELAPVKVMLHSCGGIRELLPDLIDAGLDAVNPVQVSCRGMDARELKAEFGRHICFWGGGCDTHKFLSRAKPSEVAAHVREQVAVLRPGGGFVFQQVHNILANVPPENVVAMFDAVNC